MGKLRVQSEFLLFKGVDLEGVHSVGVGHPDVQGSSKAESRGLDTSSQDRLIQELVWMEGQQRLSWLLQMWQADLSYGFLWFFWRYMIYKYMIHL